MRFTNKTPFTLMVVEPTFGNVVMEAHPGEELPESGNYLLAIASEDKMDRKKIRAVQYHEDAMRYHEEAIDRLEGRDGDAQPDPIVSRAKFDKLEADIEQLRRSLNIPPFTQGE